MVVTTRRAAAGVEPKARPVVRRGKEQRKQPALASSNGKARQSRARSRGDAAAAAAALARSQDDDTYYSPNAHDPALLSSPSYSQPPSSLFDERESIQGWASGSSHTTDCSLPGQRTAKRMRVCWKPTEVGAKGKAAMTEDSPILMGGGSMIDKQGGKSKRRALAREQPRKELRQGRAPRRTRSDPLPAQHRALTPPSASLSRSGGPSRPQSAMKHKSANKFSSRQDESILVVTSITEMPQREGSAEGNRFASVAAPLREMLAMADVDPDAFSPGDRAKQAMEARYVLRARQGLPKSDFYERHKEEEGSPTPETRRRDSRSVS